MKELKGIVLLLILYASVSRAFIYNVIILKRWNPGDQRDHYVIGCCDFHDRNNPCTHEQLAFIESLLKVSDPRSVKVILEDLCAGNELCNGMCGPFKVDSRGGLLGGLTDKCRALGLPVDNVEYRYCRVSALAPVINNLSQSPEKFAASRQLKLQTVVHEIERVMREIRSYNDGNALKAYYQKTLKSVSKGLDALKTEPHYSRSIAHYIMSGDDRKKLDTVKHMLTFDIDIFDARLVHAIVQNAAYEKILIFAGGAHVSRAVEVLKRVGYTVEYESPVSYRKEFDLHRCIGSEIIDGAFCVCPHPVDISIVGHVIQQ